MVNEEEIETELSQLRSNADNLSSCLHALLERIEQLEGATGKKLAVIRQKNEIEETNGTDEVDKKEDSDEKDHNVQVVQTEKISIDPVTGVKKRTIVTERVLTTRTYHAVPVDPSVNGISPSPAIPVVTVTDTGATAGPSSPEPVLTLDTPALVNGHRPLLGAAYESRLVTVPAEQLKQLKVEFICGEMVVTNVAPEYSAVIKPGDTIQEVNGKPARTIKDLYAQVGSVQVKLVSSDLYTAPMEFVKVLASYDSEKDTNQPSNSALPPIAVRRGEVLQVLSQDKKWLQARKVNDISQCALVPASLPTIKVSMLCPYGRRTLVILGAPGVGRRTLKSMLLAQLPNHFSTVVPVTSRPRKSYEQEGREYHFETKETILKKVRDGQMIEWGELSGTMYGTCAETVRRVVRSGRVCVLDCSAKALTYLYNGEFMPFVVVIAPPAFEELQQMNKLRSDKDTPPKTEAELRTTIAHHEQLMKSEFSKYFDQVLINRNHDITFRKLLDALDNLKKGAQWVPTEWLK
uniref:Guanylate kinase-like domain-containing protein n=1 Tax=Panagrellus redivivus TaxID=6233 RepID=A0A7E4VP65_PANRE